MSNADGIFRAKVAVPGAYEATIIPPGATAPTQKAYKYAVAGMTLNPGDFVYVIPISGTYVLLGGAVEGGGGGGGGTADALPLAGGTMQGDINMNSNKVTNLPTPSANGDAVPKSYVDSNYRTAAEQDAVDEAARSQTIKNIEGTASGSITAGTNSSITVDIPVPTGYRIFAINTIGFSGTNSDYLALRGYVVYSSRNQVKINIRSMATQSTINYSVDVWVTCAKSDLF